MAGDPSLPESSASVDIHQLLRTMVDKNASDLHLTSNSPPVLRIDGRMYPLKVARLTPADIEHMAYSVLNDKQRKTFESSNEIDLSFRWKGLSRFRANFFRQRGSVAAAIRMIPFEVGSFEELGFPDAIKSLMARPSGLVLVTGPTGSGKTTSLAAMIDYLNGTRRCHIITIEDPIEFLHKHKRGIVNQREVGADTESFSAALRYVLRQDPDIVLIGEVRDLPSMEAALRISETGHLAFATLHTNSAVGTIHRIMDFFPPRQQETVRTQLSFVLEGIISQQLIPNASGEGRSLAAEILLPNSGIRNLIREGKLHQIYGLMQMGQSKHSMQTMNQSLAKLVQAKRITKEEAIPRSPDVEELESMLQKDTLEATAQQTRTWTGTGRAATNPRVPSPKR